ncbi:hypothetical protein [Roseibium sp. RKSG952]|uniref:hypothetical protein n=1 Tax=Roseibium sp. RKSG952 TaxID=2529384 RepID=UPI0012BCA8A1|nr:hypothetical protein [Roseibium sp. RKSG952]MTI00841.1 hypothetical protein [Roseibium sp. RKSG952]
MMDTEILDMLEDIGRSARPRLSPAIQLPGETADARRSDVLRVIRGTILPRRLEFTSPNGNCLAVEVNSSRVTDVFGASTGSVPDFETEPREALTEKLAQLVSNIAAAPGPLQLVSVRPDTALEADDVGITYSEIESACAQIELPAEPRVSIVPDIEDVALDAPDSEQEPSAIEQAAVPEGSGMAQRFFDGAERFALGRFLSASDSGATQLDGACTEGQPLHPDQALLQNFAKDLAGWDADSATTLTHPQLIVMRPAGGQGAGLALLRDGKNVAAAVHEARKLGAVVSLWKSIRETA